MYETVRVTDVWLLNYASTHSVHELQELRVDVCAHSQRQSVVIVFFFFFFPGSALKQRSLLQDDSRAPFFFLRPVPQERVHTVIPQAARNRVQKFTLRSETYGYSHVSTSSSPPPPLLRFPLCPIITPCASHSLPLHRLQPTWADMRNFSNEPYLVFQHVAAQDRSRSVQQSPQQKLWGVRSPLSSRHTFPLALREQTFRVLSLCCWWLVSCLCDLNKWGCIALLRIGCFRALSPALSLKSGDTFVRYAGKQGSYYSALLFRLHFFDWSQKKTNASLIRIRAVKINAIRYSNMCYFRV